MTEMELIINGVVIFLLLLTIVCVWQLNRRLSILQGNNEDLFNLAQSLDEASTQAQNATDGLKTAARQTADELEKVVAEARQKQQELEVWLERSHHNFYNQAHWEDDALSPIGKNEEQNRSESELELIKALKAMR